MLKNISYESENEVRAVIIAMPPAEIARDGLDLPLNVMDFVQEVLINPFCQTGYDASSASATGTMQRRRAVLSLSATILVGGVMMSVGPFRRPFYLSEQWLNEIDLKAADPGYAKLSNARLTGANLDGADLTGADLTGAKLGSMPRERLAKFCPKQFFQVLKYAKAPFHGTERERDCPKTFVHQVSR